MKYGPENLDIKKGAQFNQQIRNGFEIATNSLPYIRVRGFHVLAEQIGQDGSKSIEAKAMAIVALSMPDLIASTQNENADISALSAMHAAMSDVLECSEGTSYTKTALINACVQFSRKSGILVEGQDIRRLEEQLAADIMGVWAERSWENLFICAGVPVERANIDEDLSGTDLWVQTPSGIWISVDVKAQPATIERYARDSNWTVENERTLDAREPTAQTFSLYLATTSEERSAYLAFQNPPSSGNMAPIDFRGREPAIRAARDAVNSLEDLVDTGALRPYEKVANNRGTWFVKKERRMLQ